MQRLFFATVLSASLAVGGCGDKDSAPAPDTTGPGQDLVEADESTPSDTDEPGPGRCTSNDDCDEAGAVCTCEGTCVVPTGAACTEDRNCGVPRWCNTCTGHCEEQGELCDPCTEFRGCRDGGACLPYASGGSFCGLGCLSDAGCGNGYRCVEVDGLATKQCVARSGVCEDLELCESDAECPVGQICNGTTRQCMLGCVDGGCPQGQVCQAARCQDACGTNDDCVAPAECREDGKCKTPGSCDERADCPDAETYCDRVSGQCTPGCQVDLDCGDAAKVCEDGGCVAKGCQHNYQCAFGQVCEKTTGECVPYPASEPYCAVCDPQAESDPACPSPNLCVTFQDDDGNALGDHCLVPCKDDPVDACPSGWQCQRLDDPEGGPPQFMCARPCYITPVGP